MSYSAFRRPSFPMRVQLMLALLEVRQKTEEFAAQLVCETDCWEQVVPIQLSEWETDSAQSAMQSFF
jgi:hypothetical protein